MGSRANLVDSPKIQIFYSGLGVAPILIVLPFFICVYWGPISLIFHNPFSFHPLQGLLILSISGYMIWSKRDILSSALIRPGLFGGTLIFALSSLILIAGKISSTPLVEGLSLPVGMLGLIWMMLGTKAAWILKMPVVFLIFLYPVFDKILVKFSPALENAGAFIASHLLKIFGMISYYQKNFIELPHITLQVVQACNGINHIVALTALSIFLTSTWRTSGWKKGFVILTAIPLAIFANGLRIALIGIWTAFFGTDSFHGPFDILYSSFVLLFGFAGIFLLTAFIGGKRGGIEKKEAQRASFPIEPRKRRFFYPTGVAIFVLLVMGIIGYLYPALIRIPNKNIDEFPLLVEKWAGKSVEILETLPSEVNFDLELKRVYQHKSGAQIEMFLGYLKWNRGEREIENYPSNKKFWENATIKKLGIESLHVEVNQAEYKRENQLRKAIFWYQVGENVIADRYWAKLHVVKNGLIRWRTDAALVMITMSIAEGQNNVNDSGNMNAFVKDIIPQVNQFFAIPFRH